jgi:hypothetical protein
MYPETVKWKSLINMAPVDMRDFATQFMKIYNKNVSIVNSVQQFQYMYACDISNKSLKSH